MSRTVDRLEVELIAQYDIAADLKAANQRLRAGVAVVADQLREARAECNELRAVVAAVQALCDESGVRMMSDGIMSYFTLDRNQVIAALAVAVPTEPTGEQPVMDKL